MCVGVHFHSVVCACVLCVWPDAPMAPSLLPPPIHPPNNPNTPQVWYCQQQGIAITGFSPLGASSYIQLGMDKGEGVGVLK